MPFITNNTETKRMHEAILQTVRKQIAEMEKALADLKAVEKYHADALLKLSPKLRVPLHKEDSPKIKQEKSPEVIDFSGKTRHEVVCVALKSLGGSARIPEIVEWLQTHNYGSNHEEGIFRTMIFTSMKRHEELFKKTLKEGKSIWKLVNKETVEPA